MKFIGKLSAFFAAFKASAGRLLEYFWGCEFDFEKVASHEYFRQFDVKYDTDWKGDVPGVALQSAQLALQGQAESLSDCRRRTGTMVGWLTAALVTVTAALAVSAFSDTVNWKIVSTAALADIFIFIAMCILIFGTLFGSGIEGPGDCPSILFRKTSLDIFRTIDNEYKEQWLKWSQLQNLQAGYTFNQKALYRHVKNQRRALVTLVAGFLLVFICIGVVSML